MASTAVTPPYFFVNCTSSSAAVVVIRTIPHCLAQDPATLAPGRYPELDATDVPKIATDETKSGQSGMFIRRPRFPIQVSEQERSVGGTGGRYGLPYLFVGPKMSKGEEHAHNIGRRHS